MKIIIVTFLFLWGTDGFCQDNNTIFDGGIGDGWALSEFSQQGNNIYRGGSGDGWSSANSPLHVLSTINNDFAKQIKAYPNPTSGNLLVSLGEMVNFIEVEIFNSVGQITFQKEYYNTNEIDLYIAEECGIYFIKLKAENKVTIIKMLKA